jgi:hypothetical protein
VRGMRLGHVVLRWQERADADQVHRCQQKWDMP